jgi:hypothetical protein
MTSHGMHLVALHAHLASAVLWLLVLAAAPV